MIGCISTLDQPIQGCRTAYLGRMTYRPLATPVFAQSWFPDGLDLASARKAPIMILNRRDELHTKLFVKRQGRMPAPLPAHYLPSPDKFVDFIAAGLAYGMLPDQQSHDLLKQGRLVDLAPGCRVAVKLYWHCWNLKSRLLGDFTDHLVRYAGAVLNAGGSQGR